MNVLLNYSKACQLFEFNFSLISNQMSETFVALLSSRYTILINISQILLKILTPCFESILLFSLLPLLALFILLALMMLGLPFVEQLLFPLEDPSVSVDLSAILDILSLLPTISIRSLISCSLYFKSILSSEI